LNDLNTSFQNLINALNGSQGTSTAGSVTLQSFLQNLLQDLAGGQSVAGAVVNTTA
jgi:hypothetical protein